MRSLVDLKTLMLSLIVSASLTLLIRSSAGTSCTLTISGPAQSFEACMETALELGRSVDLVANNVTLLQPFTCRSCMPYARTVRAPCQATLTATVGDVSMMSQFYENAWAVPIGLPRSLHASNPPIRFTNPTCRLTGQTCSDLFPLRISVLLGGGKAIAADFVLEMRFICLRSLLEDNVCRLMRGCSPDAHRL